MNRMWTPQDALKTLAKQLICEKHKKRGCAVCFKKFIEGGFIKDVQ